MINFQLSPYSYPPLFSSLLFFILACFVVFKRKNTTALTFIFASNCFVTFWWQFSWFILFNVRDNELALFLSKIGYSGISFLPVTFFHFIVNFLKLRRFKFVLILHYLFTAVLLLILWTTNLYVDGYFKYSWGYYPKAGLLHPIFLVYLFITDISCIYILIKKGVEEKWVGNFGNNIKYLLLGLFIFSFAIIDFLSNYGFSFYPAGVFFISIYLIIEAFAIIKYRLIEIKVVVTRVSIFVLVYSLILGIPFWLGFRLLGQGLWLLPISLMGIFATVGPFIYLYIQKKAEDQLLAEQKRYQATLRQASSGMGKIKDLGKLLNMIVYILTRSVRIEHAVIYVPDETKKNFIVAAVKRRTGFYKFPESFLVNSPLPNYLAKTNQYIILEELKQALQDKPDAQLEAINQLIIEMDAALVFSITIDKEIVAIVVMGKKESGKLYTEDDLSVFTILSNQAALAIENAQFYEEMKRTQQQLFQAEKMATIGTMADGLSHQINNRFHALGFIAGDGLDTINLSRNVDDAQKLKEIVGELENSLKRVQENVVQGGEIVQGLLRYTRKGDSAFTAVDIDAVLKSAIEMTQFKIKTHELKIVKEFDPATAPKVKGNFTQLQEVFFNMIDNGYDAMMQRKTELLEPGYQPTLIVRVLPAEQNVHIIFEDNGMGVKDSDVQKLFTPFFTTKLSSKKGTGLGLYVIKKIIEDNHGGNVEFHSKHMVGTQIKLTLPGAI